MRSQLFLQVNQGFLQKALALAPGSKGVAPWPDRLSNIHAQEAFGIAMIGQSGIVLKAQVVAEQENVSH